MVKPVLQIGDERLHQRSKHVPRRTIATIYIQEVVENLTDTMRDAGLVGIAAPQIGVMKRVFVTEIRPTKVRKVEADPLRVFINPIITWESKQSVVMYEGCGSVSDGNLFAAVRRPAAIKVSYFNATGEPREDKFSGLLARVIQHEIDHLDGILFTERVEDPRTYKSREHYLKFVAKLSVPRRTGK